MPAEISVAIIGLGSRGLGVLERLLSLADRLAPQCHVRIELIDPEPSGAGVHDRDQPDYLLLNTTCSQVSMFPDRHSVGDALGPSGPTLYEWVREQDLRVAEDGYSIGRTGRAIRPTDFLPRRILGDYLAWFCQFLLARVPERVSVQLHPSAAVDLTSEPDGLRIVLADGSELHTGNAFLTTGYTSNLIARVPADRPILEPYPMPEQFGGVRAGQTVAIAGFGLSALDAMSCLTVGRGGRYVADGAGLRYLPSGEEPRMLFYSRSGLPCRARPRVLEFGPAYRPEVFTPASIDSIRARQQAPLDFQAELWPLVLDELRLAYRRVTAQAVGAAAAGELELRVGAAAGLPKLRELLDQLDRELGGFDPQPLLDQRLRMVTEDSSAYQSWVIDELRADLLEGEAGLAGSILKATLDVLRQLRDTFRYAVDFGAVTPESLARFLGETVPVLNRAVVGPQFERHVELLALLDAGIAAIPFGPDPALHFDERLLRWQLSSRRLSTPHTDVADWLIAGWVDLPAVATSSSPLLDALYRKGQIRPLQPGSQRVVGIDIDRDQHPIDAHGSPQRRIWVLGPLCEGATFYNNLVPSPGGFSRPVHDAHRCVVDLLESQALPRDEPGQLPRRDLATTA